MLCLALDRTEDRNNQDAQTLNMNVMFFRHLDPARMFALDHTQLAGLNPHTASFIRSDFIRDPLTWIRLVNTMSSKFCAGEISSFHTHRSWNVGQSELLEVQLYMRSTTCNNVMINFSSHAWEFICTQVKRQQFIPWWMSWSTRWLLRRFFVWKILFA